jgi:O-methyltransferase
MIGEDDYVNNLLLGLQVRNVSGAIVECGTWKGGMSAGLATILGSGRDYYLLDSFEGLPEAQELDGEAAVKWQQNVDSPYYYDNCTAAESDALQAMTIAGINLPHIIKGWFEHTLPTVTIPNGIALLRMDADWYQSTYQILDSLYSQVNTDGIIVIDDYYCWDGCSRAVHDYLSVNKLEVKINHFNNVCFIRKL